MKETLPRADQDKVHEDAEKRLRKIKKFYKELASWAGMSVFMLALDLFLSGGISWSKYPVFFWGITLAYQYFNILRMQRMDRQWEEKMLKKFKGQDLDQGDIPSEHDYSEELLRNDRAREKEMADLSEYRKLKKPWKDEDLV